MRSRVAARVRGATVTSSVASTRVRVGELRFATELRRIAGINAASQALGRADGNTTLGIYGHRDQADLEVAMEAYARWLEQQRERSMQPNLVEGDVVASVEERERNQVSSSRSCRGEVAC